ncbi:hypothetical protein MUN76_05745 [Leucobacter rhizosphaerae]|uniref:Cyanophycinase n=1 Tax=Leucobacter rhizosphaerae TaxID=2932245 RepID=A0ABY4FZ12_9MICO|nr:hypothetical protein [Leucobacter rhizosphaerae]UOQ61471.1 hypothetical protein MUN76_05745 [Leucobacter rhizosphaerae]
MLALFRSEDPARPPFEARHDTAVLTAIREILDRGGVVAGTSAGLAVQQAAPMVSGGTSREAWARDAAAGYADDDALRYIPAGGLGFFSEALLDSHFTEWGRVPRAIRLAQATGERLAIGVDEHTALVVRRTERTGEVIGTGGVHLLDLAEAEFAEGTSGPGATGVRWTHLTAGDRIDFARGVTTRAASIHVAPGDGPAPERANDLWGDTGGPVLLALAQRLLASPERLATADTSRSTAGTGDASDPAPGPRFRLSLHRDERTTWTDPGGFTDLRLSITPLPSAA